MGMKYTKVVNHKLILLTKMQKDISDIKNKTLNASSMEFLQSKLLTSSGFLPVVYCADKTIIIN